VIFIEYSITPHYYTFSNYYYLFAYFLGYYSFTSEIVSTLEFSVFSSLVETLLVFYFLLNYFDIFFLSYFIDSSNLMKN
jgi:hypothetical protein